VASCVLYQGAASDGSHANILPLQKTVKCLQLDTAIAMWKLLFSDGRRWPLVDAWCDFLQTHHNRAISKDTWVQLFDFAKASQNQGRDLGCTPVPLGVVIGQHPLCCFDC